VVGGASAVLSRSRVVLGAALFAALLVYYETSEHWWSASVWWNVAWIACVLIPAVFGLVLAALPLNAWRGLLAVGVAFVLLTVVLTVVHASVFANFTRLAATALLGWWFLGVIEMLSLVVVIALIIPWVDALSVWRGPTKEIVTHHEHVFTVLSFAFPVPGEHAAANLGVPDLLFFALFLGAAYRFDLRVPLTWLCMVTGLGVTIALTVWLNLSGLPALPAISLGFLAPNADLLWRAVRREAQDARPGSDTART